MKSDTYISEEQSLVDAYDKHVIFSKTDLKGVITHVSDAFCKISGYSKEELVGQHHNMVRHPDMPSSTFKEVWDLLKKKYASNCRSKKFKKRWWILLG